MTHTTHECMYCGTVWLCDGLHPYSESSCIRPYQWECRPCFDLGRHWDDAALVRRLEAEMDQARRDEEKRR